MNRSEILRHRAHVGSDGHLVVVQDDDEVAPRCAGVVEPLVGEAAGEGSVAEHGDDAEAFLVEITRGRHPESGGNRGCSMAGAESVVVALAALQESGQTLLLPERLHASVASGEKLVRISLVTHVPHQLIAGRIERRMERDRQLDDAKSRADVPARS